MITKELDIYLLRDTERGFIRAVQGDSGNEVVVHIKDADLPSGTTAKTFVKKPSGLAVYADSTVSDNDITFDLTAQMIAEAGTSRCQIHLENDGDVLTTFFFYIFVEERLGEGAPESETSVDVFDQAVAAGIEAIEEAVQDAIDEIEESGYVITFTDPNDDGNIVITIGATGATGSTGST